MPRRPHHPQLLRLFWFALLVLLLTGCTENKQAPDGAETSADAAVKEPGQETKADQPKVDPRLGKGWWHDSRYIRDASGRTIILRGWNLSSSHKGSATFGHTTKEDYKRIAGWGFNVLRFVMNWALLEETKGSYNQSYIDGILKRLDWAKEAGLYVVLDMHQDVFGPGFNHNGAPKWACPQSNYDNYTSRSPWYMSYLTKEVQACFDHLFKTKEIRDAYAAAWKKLAEATHKHEAVVGFDLMNEPFWGTTSPATFHSEVLQPFYQASIAKIREVTNEHLIFIEPIAFIGLGALYGPFAKFKDKKLVYAAHFYLPSMHDNGAYDGKKEKLEKPLFRLHEEAKALGIPLWIGEYGGPARSDDYVQYMNDLEGLVEQFGTGSAYWSYDNGGFSPVDKDNKITVPAFNALQRPFPQAVAGALTSYKFDLAKKSFTLIFTEDGVTNRKTTIFLPKHTFGDAPTVTSSDADGTWTQTWDKARQILTIEANPEQTTHTITVQP